MAIRKAALLMLGLPLFASCTKEYVTEEYITKEVVGGNDVKTYFYDVVPNDWKVEHADDGRVYLYADFENRELTDQIADGGMVTGSVLYTYNIGENLQSWNNMPYILPYKTKNDSIIGEVIRFEYEPQHITFVIEDLTGKEPEPMVNNITFKVSFVSNQGSKGNR